MQSQGQEHLWPCDGVQSGVEKGWKEMRRTWGAEVEPGRRETLVVSERGTYLLVKDGQEWRKQERG